MKKFKIISPLLILLSLVGFSAYAANAVVGTCDIGSGTNSGFWFFQNLPDNHNLNIKYEALDVAGGVYNNSQLPPGLHCLPLPKPDATLRMCLTYDGEGCSDLSTSEQSSSVQSASCFEDAWDNQARPGCYWAPNRPRPSPQGTPGIIKASCGTDQMGFWFNQHNFDEHRKNMNLYYLVATGSYYNNSQLPAGLHCLPLPAQGASIRVCQSQPGGPRINPLCFTSTVDLDNAKAVTCNSKYRTCGWSSEKPT
jgi:hypothetical protein